MKSSLTVAGGNFKIVKILSPYFKMGYIWIEEGKQFLVMRVSSVSTCFRAKCTTELIFHIILEP